MNRLVSGRLVLCGLGLLAAVPAAAGQGASAELHVGVTVVRSCTVSTRRQVEPDHPAETVRVACAKGVAAPRVADSAVAAHTEDTASNRDAKRAADAPTSRVAEDDQRGAAVVQINF